MKIYKSSQVNALMRDNHFHFLPFEFEKEKWQISDNIDECDVIPVLVDYGETANNKIIDELLASGYKDQTVLILSLFHIDDNEDNRIFHQELFKLWRKRIKGSVYIIHSDMNEHSEDTIFYDILWNRQKAYFCDYEKFDLHNRAWSKLASKKMYQLTEIKKNLPQRIFLSPTRIYKDSNHPRIQFRSKLLNLLKDKNGFYSDHQNGQVLESEEGKEFDRAILSTGGSWWPVSNNLYNSSYVSIYVETILDKDNIRSITEKTWDPLIKGHFILPFGYCGLMKDIESYGFKLPSWIDYSYDNIHSVRSRWMAYSQECERICALDLNVLQDYYDNNLDLLKHNRRIFYTRSYDTLHDKILQKLSSRA